MKKLSILLINLCLLFVLASCYQYVFVPVDIPSKDPIEEEPIITDPTDTNDPEMPFYDNFTTDTTEYYFTNGAEKFKDNMVVEDGHATLYGGAMYVQFPSANKPAKLDFDEYNYELSFVLSPVGEAFDLKNTDNKLFDFVLITGKYKEEDNNLGSTGGTVYALITESDDNDLLDIYNTDGWKFSDSSTKITSLQNDTMTISFKLSKTDDGVKAESYVNGSPIGTATNTNEGVDAFYLTMHGPYDGPAEEPEATDNHDNDQFQGRGAAFAIMENFTLRAIPKTVQP